MKNSNDIFAKAKKIIPGGVNSPVRSFNGVGGTPIFFDSADGAYLTDVAGKKYIDYVGSWGPMIVGHRHPDVMKAIKAQLDKSLTFGAPTEIEVELAEKIISLLPQIEMIRMVSSGTEATMSALRLARGFTGRKKIIKFNGCYHGHSDSLLVAAGSGILTLGIPSSAGVPETFVQETLVAEFNRLETVEQLFSQHGNEIAAVIIEPVAGNMNCIPPLPEFLNGLRALCDRYQSLLIIDEVMTGFRVGLQGAIGLYGIRPDLVTLGKVIGGGMPVAAFGGRRDIMEKIAPLGPVYQAGTLSGNPVAMAAGLATLELITTPNFYEKISDCTRQLMKGLEERAHHFKIPFHTVSVGSMFGIFFTESHKVETFDDVKQCDIARFKRFFHFMLEQGIYFAPSAFEAGFVSSCHAMIELQKTWESAEHFFQKEMNSLFTQFSSA